MIIVRTELMVVTYDDSDARSAYFGHRKQTDLLEGPVDL